MQLSLRRRLHIHNCHPVSNPHFRSVFVRSADLKQIRFTSRWRRRRPAGRLSFFIPEFLVRFVSPMKLCSLFEIRKASNLEVLNPEGPPLLRNNVVSFDRRTVLRVCPRTLTLVSRRSGISSCWTTIVKQRSFQQTTV